jgi:osmotically-inducible protein OsmY
VDLPDPAAARAFAFDEPYYQAGVYRDVLLRRWHNSLGRTMWDFPEAVRYGRGRRADGPAGGIVGGPPFVNAGQRLSYCFPPCAGRFCKGARLSNVTGAGSLEGVAMTDEELAKNVAAEMSADPKVDSTLIDVVVDGGEVLLRGTVGSFWQKREAQKAAERVDGVTTVDNIVDVRLLTEHRRADAELRADVLHALSLNGMIPSTVDASVDDGTVLLSGTVDLEHQREEAVRIAGNVRGVVNVLNDIFLNPPLTDG